MSETISVIIPVYKVEEYLDECLASVTGQTWSDLEIILVDDGSPDRCPEMCDAWAEKDHRIRVVHKENGGLSDARNAGLDVCTGAYIAFVDSDDWIRPDMYAAMMRALKAENADLCACNITTCYPDRRVSWGCREYTVGDSETILDLLYSDSLFPVCAWNKLYKREMWDGFRFPVGKICEDAYTTYLLVHKAERIVQIPEPMYCYRIRSGSIMTAAFSKKRMDEEEAWRLNYEFVKDHYPRLARKAFDFYLESVNVLIHDIPKDKRKEFMAEYTCLRRILKRNIGYVLFFSQMDLKHRAYYLKKTAWL